MTSMMPSQKKEFIITEIESKRELIKRTVCKGATDDELQLFIHVCKRTGLDPFMKQIHAVKRKSKNGDVMTIQTGIDGLRLTADRTGNYAPGKESTFQYDEHGKIKSATAYIKKRTLDGVWHEVSATAFYSEYKPTYTNDFWDNKGHIMLSKCAEALALRKAFPAEMSGLYTSEEMQQGGEPLTTDLHKGEDVVMENEEQLIDLLFEKNEIPSPSDFQPYLEFVRERLPKEKTLAHVIKGWIENPLPFLNHYKRWIEKIKFDTIDRQQNAEVVNM